MTEPRGKGERESRSHAGQFLEGVFADYAANPYDALAKGYAPKHGNVKDFSLVKHAGRWHLFHILGQDGLICLSPDAESRIGHASTADFVTWITHDPLIPALPGTWESHHIYAPFVFRWRERFHMIYTGINRNMYECLGYAVSDDLFHWRRHPEPVLDPCRLGWAAWDREPDLETRGSTPCRDPHVHVADDGTLYVYFSAVEAQSGMPVVGVASSSDGVHWRDEGVAYRGWDKTPSCCGLLESSCMHPLDSGRYLLTFNTRGHVRYVVGDNPLDFNGVEPRIIPTEGYTSLEVISRTPARWLVAYFGGKAGCRMSLGTLLWKGDEIVGGARIESAHELAGFVI